MKTGIINTKSIHNNEKKIKNTGIVRQSTKLYVTNKW